MLCRWLASDHLEKLFVSIIQDKEPDLDPLIGMFSPSLEPESDDSQTAYSSPDVQPTPETLTTTATEPMCHSSVEAPSVVSASLSSSGVASSSSECASSRTTVIRGFSPSQVSIPALQLRSQESMKRLALDAIPEPQAAPAYCPVQIKKQPAKLALGGSSGDESSPQSLVQHKALAPQGQPKMFQLGASSGSVEDPSLSLKSAMKSLPQLKLMEDLVPRVSQGTYSQILAYSERISNKPKLNKGALGFALFINHRGAWL